MTIYKARDVIMSAGRFNDKGQLFCVRFESFAYTMMSKRQDAISQHNDTKSLYYKQILNSTFEAEGQNNAWYDKISSNNAKHASLKQLKQDHKTTRKISDDTCNSDDEVIEEAQYMVCESSSQFKRNKPLQEAVFTLDNSKFRRENIGFCCIDSDLVWRLWVQIAQQNQSPVTEQFTVLHKQESYVMQLLEPCSVRSEHFLELFL
ncbi:MAG: hypothetical protein EZS28_005604 [Streblomastix strix]|uniref:Uncharacterized protein n=1 Tax=Streblomastix strix TaxID=222440 RepID=A0A5J4WV08_9EUKA|nr:MAG: hypothetical protein EZS28_005604 [Streblomastix strix]